MAEQFVKRVTATRKVEILFNDTLQKISVRERGDAALWYELVHLNNLIYPYLAESPGDRVLAYGDYIRVPSQIPSQSADIRNPDIFGADVKLIKGRLQAVNGDLELVTGSKNLAQALGHAVKTEIGELLFHDEYGCFVTTMVGLKSAANAFLAKGFVERTVNSDLRVNRVGRSQIVLAGDTLTIELEAVATNGEEVKVSIDGIPS